MISEIFNIGFKLFLYENSLISYLYSPKIFIKKIFMKPR